MLKYMANRYNFFYFEAEFKKYLVAGNAGSATIKSYVSDLHYFFSWVQNEQHIAELAFSELPEVFSHSTIRLFYGFLTASETSQNTSVRRLATLRKFFTFCVEQRWLTTNPVHDYDKHTKGEEKDALLTAYKKYLAAKPLSEQDLGRHINVIKDLITNYQSL
jgi:site-specific recombinase XerD